MSINRAGNGIPLYPSTIYKVYEDTNFVAGDSPVTLDVRTDLTPTGDTKGRDANNGYIACDGPGSILVKLYKGTLSTSGDQFTLYAGDVCSLLGEGVTKIVITHSGTDSAYRVNVE
jgi:hypothetical protein